MGGHWLRAVIELSLIFIHGELSSRKLELEHQISSNKFRYSLG